MAFVLDRVDAASRLGVSSRTIDRHIQAWRIRTRRIGKKIFLEDDDVEALRNMDPARREEDYVVIFDTLEQNVESVSKTPQTTGLSQTGIDNKALTEFVRFYEEAQVLIGQKENLIQDLSYKLGKVETEMKNMVPLVEYNKATFLLESAKEKNTADVSRLSETVNTLEKEISKRNTAIISLALLFVLVLAFSIMFLFYTRLL